MNKGLLSGKYSVLSEDDVQQIHDMSLKVLQNQGMMCESDLTLNLFIQNGAKVDKESRVIFVSPEMIEKALQSAPKSFVMYGQDPQYDMLAEVGNVFFGMGGTPEPFIYDHTLHAPRISTKEDMIQCTRVGQALQNVDFIMALCSARNVPPEESIFHEWDAIFRNTSKPVICSSPEIGRAHD